MTSPDFSVLLLAWDEADPSVAVLGGAALPPTLPLVYQLAARQPVLAVYPHLPEAAPAETAPEAQEAATNSAEAPTLPRPAAEAPTAPELPPGVRQLPSPAATAEPLAVPSHLVGLQELSQRGALLLRLASIVSPGSEIPAAPRRSQWPSGAAPSQAGEWQVPAAPYAGASAAPLPPPRVPNPPPRGSASVREAADLAQATRNVQAPLAEPTLLVNAHPQAGDLRFDPDPELPAVLRPEAFDEPTQEMGPAEAIALLAVADDLVPDAPASAPALAPAPAQPEPALELQPATPATEPRLPTLDGLNFRMIQYARQAAQLVRDRRDFTVIYAPNWPAWLAALEIRNSTGRPLVLYATSLVADFTAPAERGWLLEVERMALRRAHLILVPDDGLRQRLRATYGATIGEVRVVPAADEAALQRVLGEAAAG